MKTSDNYKFPPNIDWGPHCPKI